MGSIRQESEKGRRNDEEWNVVYEGESTKSGNYYRKEWGNNVKVSDF
jgi:hypothetical protein